MSRILTAASPPAVLHDIDWRTYTRLLRVFERSRRFRLTYDRGTLEITVPLFEHENPADLLGSLVTTLLEELNLPARFGGSVTLRRRRRARGLEPDCCFWIANAARLQGRRQLDLRTYPPPDLAVEVDVTNSSLDRMSIYARLGVPEVWRLSAGVLTFNILAGRNYQPHDHSVAFPQLAPADLLPFLEQQGQTDDISIVRQFREWVREHLLSKPPAPPVP